MGTVRVRVTPRARRSEVAGEREGSIVVRVSYRTVVLALFVIFSP